MKVQDYKKLEWWQGQDYAIDYERDGIKAWGAIWVTVDGLEYSAHFCGHMEGSNVEIDEVFDFEVDIPREWCAAQHKEIGEIYRAIQREMVRIPEMPDEIHFSDHVTVVLEAADKMLYALEDLMADVRTLGQKQAGLD